MRKNFLLWMGVALMMAIGMSSCSSDDDDYSYVQEFGDNNNKENFIGTWHLLHYYTGWGIKEDYEAGEVTVTFTKNGDIQVINKRDDQHPFSTGNMAYYFVDIEKSIFTGEPRACMSFGFCTAYLSPYSFHFTKIFCPLTMFKPFCRELRRWP